MLKEILGILKTNGHFTNVKKSEDKNPVEILFIEWDIKGNFLETHNIDVFLRSIQKNLELPNFQSFVSHKSSKPSVILWPGHIIRKHPQEKAFFSIWEPYIVKRKYSKISPIEAKTKHP